MESSISATAFEMIRQVINIYLRAPFVRAVLVCHTDGDVAVGGSGYGGKERKLIREMASSMFPPVIRMVQNSGNKDEAQSLSLPDENLHLLIFWLTAGYYLLVSFSGPQNPYNPPGSAVKTWAVIRSIVQSPEPRESLSILCADLETEIGLERHIHSDKKESSARPNP